ncbi:MAG TPA: 5-(carboxyamino)imidazole ribonucleotide mutase [Planctomycetota bacterium]|nr:5-(carboxyamino)imidazole ribonucleotide mutase [Planctomycetota bacterium]HRR81239.1 5-(carboxyamino)imidazole ribonucleotide mutase [Planctomycetota bacterium]HRT96722.1 5-(carboxyamino)imidazole ribonucleotide mutase [Planctomycetota bacterium]
MAARKVAVVMGSEADLATMTAALEQLARFGIPYDIHVLSAHRSPDAVAELAAGAEAQGIELFIAAAGKAAHLAGVIASKTTLPVIGCPMETGLAGGLDSLLSMVQMPQGVPVATMGTGKSGAVNAAILAAQILARSDPDLRQKLAHHKADMAARVVQASRDIRQRLGHTDPSPAAQ